MKVKYLDSNSNVQIITGAIAVTPTENAAKAVIEYVAGENKKHLSVIINSSRLMSITIEEEKA